MSRRHALIMSAVVALVTAACGTSGTTPTASQLPTTSIGQPTIQPTAPASLFTSSVYHYSIALPAGWTATSATAAWDGTVAVSHTDPFADLFSSSTGTLAWAYAAPTTKSVADLSAAQTASDAAAHPCPTTVEIDEPTTVGGDPARLTMKHCPTPGDTLIANTAVIHDGIGYFFYFQHSSNAGADAADVAVFKTLLSGVEFR